MARGLKKKSGFALVTVLVILLILTFMSAILMDLVLNAHATSMETIQREQLYNAAQGGIEWGIAMLRKNKDDLDAETKTGISGVTFDSGNSSQVDAIRATINSGDILDQPQPSSTLFDPAVTVTVDILDCNYDPPANYDAFLPPVRSVSSSGGGGGGGSAALPEGMSAVVDPNRLMTFGGSGGVEGLSYVIRSRATKSGSSLGLETMVVISR